jgi:hypothetical protein
MLGLEGIAVPLGFILTIFSTLLCIAYGIINWNKGALSEAEVKQEQIQFAEKEHVEENP